VETLDRRRGAGRPRHGRAIQRERDRVDGRARLEQPEDGKERVLTLTARLRGLRHGIETLRDRLPLLMYEVRRRDRPARAGSDDHRRYETNRAPCTDRTHERQGISG